VKSEDRFKIAQFRSGYKQAIEDVFDLLSAFHHDPRGFDREMIDVIWEQLKDLEKRARRIEASPGH
jgi:hypothetical protein